METEIRLVEIETAKTPDTERLNADASGMAGEAGWKGNVIILPGGAYEWLSPREDRQVAREFAAAGWKPWVLYYPIRTPDGDSAPLGLRPMRHAAAAVKKVRLSCPGLPVVVCGFSAGGHVAASLGVHWNDREIFPVEDQALIRPDAMILCYPVITAGKWTHRKSIDNLVEGTRLNYEAYFSLENYVTSETPPAFLWHTAEDEMVPVQNSLLFAERLAAMGVPFELHIYPYGAHGLSLATAEVEEPAKSRYPDSHVAGWFAQCAEWLDVCLGHLSGR